jgi:hypothetical protein
MMSAHPFACPHQRELVRGPPPGSAPRRRPAPGAPAGRRPRSVNCQDVELGVFGHAPQLDRSALSPRGLNFATTVTRRWADGRTGG